MRKLQFIALVVAVLTGACTSIPTSLHPVVTYRGYFVYHSLGVDFSPDGSSENWCLIGALGDLPSRPAPGDNQAFAQSKSHIVVQGRLSSPGHYGYLGSCSRELQVVRVMEVTPSAPKQP